MNVRRCLQVPDRWFMRAERKRIDRFHEALAAVRQAGWTIEVTDDPLEGHRLYTFRRELPESYGMSDRLIEALNEPISKEVP